MVRSRNQIAVTLVAFVGFTGFTLVMPFLARALLEKRARYSRWAERMGAKKLFAKNPEARGYLRSNEGYRMLDRREELVAKLFAELKRNEQVLRSGLDYSLARPTKKKPRSG